MSQGTILTKTNRGCSWAEVDDTHECVFVHITSTAHNRILYPDDRVEFDIVENPLKPGKRMAIHVQWIGHVVARQISSECSNERPNGQSNGRPYGQGEQS